MYRKQMAELEKEDKYRRDRMKLRELAEKTRANKHEELLKLGRDLQISGLKNSGFNISDPQIASLLHDDSNTSNLAYLSDPKNYMAIREKQLSLDR